MSDTKVCRNCRQPKPLSQLAEFTEGIKNPRKRYRCIESCKAQVRKSKPKNEPIIVEEKEISEEEYKEIIASENGIALDSEDSIELEASSEEEHYVITTVQNNTYINEELFKNILAFCAENDARLVVLAASYYNPNNPNTVEELEKDIWFDHRVAPFMLREEADLGGIKVMGSVDLSPTRTNPLSSMEPIARGKSAIFGHPQVQMKCVATPQGDLPIMLHTTGSLTKKNYRSRRATGIKADFHHTFGFIYLQTKGNKFHLRHISAHEDGGFVDLGVEYEDGKNYFVGADAFVLGDIHFGSECPKNQKTMIELAFDLQPHTVVLHDIFDGASINHHEEHNPFAKFTRPFNTLQEEINYVAESLDYYETVFHAGLVVVDSNHNDFLNRWLTRTDWRELDKETAQIYLDLAQARINSDGDFNAFAHVMGNSEFSLGNTDFLSLDESFKIHDIELGMHGHLGANGARGSARSFARVGFKSISGHTHTPQIEKGCYIVGTSTKLKLGYTKGLSSWLNAHCIVYPNGKRQLIFILDGEYKFS